MQKIARLYLLATVVCFAVIARGENIGVPYQYRQSNIGGSCAHACVTTQLRQLGLASEANYYWVNHRGGVDRSWFEGSLGNWGYDVVDVSDSLDSIRLANEAGHIVQVEVRAGCENKQRVTHAILVKDIAPDFVRYINPNDVGQDWYMTLDNFKANWTGWAFYIQGVK